MNTDGLLSPSEEGIWIAHSTAGRTSAYTTQLFLRIRGDLDTPALEQALNAVVMRHAALRRRYRLGSDGVRAGISPSSAITLAPAPPESFDDLLQQQAGYCFDLAREPLVRARLVGLAADMHALLITAHHIVLDGWSEALFLDSLSSAYRSFVGNGHVRRPPVDQRYPEYVTRKREFIATDEYAAQLSFWRDYLCGWPRVPPPDPDAADGDAARAGVETFRLDEKTSAEVIQRARRARTTPSSVFLTALVLALSRLCGRAVAVGLTVSGRDPDLDGETIGSFADLLVYRSAYRPQVPPAELLTSVHRGVLAVLSHQDVSFGAIMRTVPAATSRHASDLLDAVFTFHNAPQAEPALVGLGVERFELPITYPKFPLLVLIRRSAGIFTGTVEFDTARWQATAMRGLVEQIVAALGAICGQGAAATAHRDQPAPTEPANLAPSRRSLCSGPQVASGLIPNEFTARAAERPDAPALIFGSRQLTYQQLDAESDALAAALLDRGVECNSLVGVCADPSPETVVGMLGILKAGGAYVPLDPSYPNRRLDAVARSADLRLVVAHVPHQERIQQLIGGCGQVVAVPAPPRSARAPAPPSSPHDLAYCLYTSGTTGQPKGVLVPQHNVMRLLSTTAGLFHFGPSDIWSLFHSFAFDFSVWEMFGALLSGGTLVIVPDDVRKDPKQFARLLEERGVTVLSQTPSALRGLVQLLARDGRVKLGALRHVILGGEALDEMLARQVLRVLGPRPCLVNMYGITETTVHATYRQLHEEDLGPGSGCPIGVALPDMSVSVVGDRLQPVSDGELGELCIGGEGLAWGYLGQPRITAERFVPDPFSPTPGRRMYRSGDYGRRSAHGELLFAGRSDDQVKVRGHRIELLEVEAAVRTAPGVLDAAVATVDQGIGGPRLAAWYVSDGGADGEEIRWHLQRELPAFMVPAFLIRMDVLPRTPNGKVDRAALRSRATVHREPSIAVPTSEDEHSLVDIWQALLGVDRVGVDDDFFALGGDSMLAIQASARMSERGHEFSARDIYRHPTIAGLLKQRDRRSGSAGTPVRPRSSLTTAPASLSRGSLVQVYPLSACQRLMVASYADCATARPGVYHVQQSLRIRHPDPQPEAMRTALCAVAADQPALRTRFVRAGEGGEGAEGVEGKVWQGLIADCDVALPVIDLSNLAPSERELQLERRRAADRCRPFDVSPDAPLVRFWWTWLEADVFEFSSSAHHAIDDGWGNQAFLHQLFTAYGQARRGALAPPAVEWSAISEFVGLERAMARFAPARRFWSSLAVEPAPRPPCIAAGHRHGDGRHLSHVLDNRLAAAIAAVSRSRAVSLKAVYLDAFISLIGELTNRPAPTVGVVTSGRTDDLARPLTSVGLFWSFLPVTHPQAEAPSSRRLDALHARLIDIDGHTPFPLDEIEHMYGSDLFWATFNFVNFHNAFGSQSLGTGQLLQTTGHDLYHYPLNLRVSIEGSGGSTELYLDVDPAYFDREQAIRIVGRYLELLEVI